ETGCARHVPVLSGALRGGLRVGVETGARGQLDARRARGWRRLFGRLPRLAVAAPEVAVAGVRAGQVARQLGQGHFIDTALELDDHVQGNPVVVPAPGIELRVVGGAQVQVPVLRHQAQQVPYLFLAPVVTARLPADETVRHFVAQPVAGPGHDGHVFRLEPDLFVQFPVHGLFGRFTPVDATLRELPGVGAYALAPEHLVFLVEQNDADIRPEAFSVKHNLPQFLY